MAIGNLVGGGSVLTFIRKTGGAYDGDGIWVAGTESNITALGDILPVRDDRRIELPSGFRREGMRMVHLWPGSTALRTVGAVGQLEADECDLSIDGRTERMVVVAQLDHIDDTRLRMSVDHRRYLLAIPEQRDTETGAAI